MTGNLKYNYYFIGELKGKYYPLSGLSEADRK